MSDFEEIISATVRAMAINHSDIKWGIKGSKIGDRLAACLWINYGDHEFINIKLPVPDDCNEVQTITFVYDYEYYLINKAITVLGCYGLANLFMRFGQTGTKFTYELNEVGAEEDDDDDDLTDLSKFNPN